MSMGGSGKRLYVEVVGNVSSLVSSMGVGAASVEQFGRRTATATTQYKNALKGASAESKGFITMGKALALGGAALGLVYVSAARKMASFEAIMATNQALIRGTLKPTDDLAKVMGDLRQAALTMGQGIGYSADEVAQAEQELVKAGISVEDILGGALKGALDLAAAGQMDVAEATETAAIAMTQFSKSGKDVPHIADLLAAGADRALGSVSDLSQALRYGGSAAAQAGWSIEETIGTLAEFAQGGQMGTHAGMELQQMLRNLQKPSQSAKYYLDKYVGSVYQANGSMISSTQLAQRLHDKIGSLPGPIRNAAMATIFSSNAVRAANILMKDGADANAKWIETVNQQGFAALQASGKMDSFAGDLQKLKAAFDNAMIGIGEDEKGPLRSLAQDLTSVINTWNKMPGSLKSTAVGLGAVVAAMALVGGGALVLIPRIELLDAALLKMSGGAIGATAALSTLSKAGLVVAALAAADFGISKLGGLMTTSPEIDNVTASLVAYSKTGKVSSEMTKDFGKNLTDLGKQLHTLAHPGAMTSAFNFIKKIPVIGFGAKVDTLAGTGEDYDQAKKNIQSYDTALSGLVTSGNAAAAAGFWNRIVTSAKTQGVSIDSLTKLFPKYANVLSASKVSAEAAGTGIDQYGNDVSTAAQKTQHAIDVAKAYLNELHALADPLFAMHQALSGLSSAQDAATKATKKYGAESKQARDANIKLASAALNVQAAAKTLATSVELGSTSIGKAKQQLHAWVKEGMMTKAQAHDVAQAFEHLISKADKLNKADPDIEITAHASEAERELDKLAGKLGSLVGRVWNVIIKDSVFAPPKPPGHETGGMVHGKGSGTSDSIPAMLSNGEYVMPADQTREYRPILDAMRVQRFAKGGAVGPPWHAEGPRYYDQAHAFFGKWAKKGPYWTSLTNSEERDFEHWVDNNRVPFDIRARIADYDMRGYWKRSHGKGWHHGDHFPDTFKTPYDTTFSRESKYATADNPFDWRGNNLVNMKTGRVIFSPRGHAAGGSVHGPGSGTSDSIPAWLSNGEYVMPAAATERYLPLLDAMRAQKFATGGIVSALHLATGGKITQGNVLTKLGKVTSKAGTSTGDLANAIAAVNDLANAWQATIQAMQDAHERKGLEAALSKANAALAKARASGNGEKDAASQVHQATVALRQFNEQQKQNAVTARITAEAARLERKQEIASNKEIYAFDRMTQQQQIAYLKQRMAGEKKFSDQWLSDEERRRQLIQQEKADQQSLADNKAQLQFDQMSSQQQIAYLDQKMAKEQEYSDQWMSDYQARQSLIQQQQDSENDLASQISQLLQQRDSIVADQAAAQATYAQSIADATRSYQDQIDQILASRKQQIMQFNLDDVTSALRNTDLDAANRVLTNLGLLTDAMKAYNDQATDITSTTRGIQQQTAAVTQWSDGLDELRSKGLSQDAIDILGLDDSPAKLSQVQAFASATTGQIQQLNAAVAQEMAAAGREVTTEQTHMYGDVGQQLQDAQLQFNDAVAQAWDTLQTQLQSDAQQLAALGQNTGMSIASAIAAGLASGIPGIIAVAQQLQQLMSSALAGNTPATATLLNGNGLIGPSDGTFQPRTSGLTPANPAATSTLHSIVLSQQATIKQIAQQYHETVAQIIATNPAFTGMPGSTLVGSGSHINVYDSGGTWPSGTLGANLSGQPEYVFTQAQWRMISAGAARAASPTLTITNEFSVDARGAQEGVAVQIRSALNEWTDELVRAAGAGVGRNGA